MAGPGRPSRRRGSGCSRRPRAQGLEGIVAKRLDSRVRARPAHRGLDQDQAHAAPGARDRRLAPGRGAARRADRRAADGLLRRTASFVYAGRVGTGFTEQTLDDLAQRLDAAAARTSSPFDGGAEAPARGRVRRAVAGRRDRVPRVDRRRRDARAVVQGAARGQAAARRSARGRGGDAGDGRSADGRPRRCSTRSSGCPEGALAVLADGRRLKLTNWDKVLYPADRLHQGRPDRLLRARRAGRAARTCATGR